MPDEIQAPQVEFLLINESTPAPTPASESLNGSLPSRAVQKCSPVTEASGFGWYIYPPVDFALRWDGNETCLALLEDNEPGAWRSLAGGGCVRFPAGRAMLGELTGDRLEDLDRVLPPEGQDIANADPQAVHLDHVEMNFGVAVRTSPGWVTVVRSVPNWPLSGYQVLEGVVETEWYRSDLPTIIRLLEPGRIVRFYRHVPAACLQIVPKVAVRLSHAAPARIVSGAANFSDEEWTEWVDSVAPRFQFERPASYKVRQRRRALEAQRSQLGAAEENLLE